MAEFTQSDLKNALQDVNNAQSTLNQYLNPLTQNSLEKYKSDGFTVPAAYSADGNGLPYSKAPTYRDATLQRNIITWFVPEFGTVRMYVNPSNINYSFNKTITPTRTKGGYSLQYWGEELTNLTITGTTGSAGVEGVNVLYEIYRAEQYAFDTAGLVISSNNAAQNLITQGFNAAGNAIGSGGVGQLLFGGTATGNAGTSVQNAGLIGGLFGLNSPLNSLGASNYVSLAQLAFTVEMYYDGWVYRGYFKNMTITEKPYEFDYNIGFVATQRRGYRTNFFPWHRNPAQGPSQYNTPNSFSGTVTGEQPIGVRAAR
jgi:hypothetical protein